MNAISPRVIVVSGVNLRSGGTLSILQDCLSYLQENCLDEFQVIALVHDKKLLSGVEGIEFIEFPKSIQSYLYRLYYEYVYFNQLSKEIKPYLWLSLHDMTPNVVAEVRAVYCHNPSPFYKLQINQILLDPTFAVFNLFYKYIYQINIKKNDYVIVQQDWLRTLFKKIYAVNSVVVAYPDIQKTYIQEKQKTGQCCTFFFPTLPRFFKNIEVIVDALRILNKQQCKNFEVNITIDGTENRYARYIANYSSDVLNINLIGRQTRNSVFSLYEQCDYLIFPSKLETWGLPISEFKQTQKPMLVADLPYAHETVGNYQQVSFFNPDNPQQLATLMASLIDGNLKFSNSTACKVAAPFTHSWSELFNLLITR